MCESILNLLSSTYVCGPHHMVQATHHLLPGVLQQPAY